MVSPENPIDSDAGPAGGDADASGRRPGGPSPRADLLLDAIGDGIFSLDREGRCTTINLAAEKIIGYPAAVALGSVMHALVHPDCRNLTRCAIRTGRFSGLTLRGEEEFVHSAGHRVLIDAVVAPLFEGGVRSGCVVSFRDVTGQRRVSNQIEQSRRLTSLGRLAANVAHEFNNVLMGIQPFAEILQRQSGLPVVVARSARQILGSVERGRRISQEILRFTQPRESVLEVLALEPWLRSIRGGISRLLTNGEHLVIESRPLFVLADPAQLTLVVTNIVTNAIEALRTVSGERTIRIAIDRAGSGSPDSPAEEGNAPGYIRLSVSDTGSGMDAETMQQIFEPLFTTKLAGGLGLGLSVCHQIIRQHGGHISAESVSGSGTTIHVFLREAVRNEIHSSPVQPRRTPGNALGKVLLIEDDEIVGEGICILLQMEGVDVRVVRYGRETLSAIERFRPDAVILDLGLPDMPGAEVFRLIRTSHPHLPVIFSTGHGDEVALMDQSGVGRVGFLQKPYDVEALISKLLELGKAE